MLEGINNCLNKQNVSSGFKNTPGKINFRLSKRYKPIYVQFVHIGE